MNLNFSVKILGILRTGRWVVNKRPYNYKGRLLLVPFADTYPTNDHHHISLFSLPNGLDMLFYGSPLLFVYYFYGNPK